MKKRILSGLVAAILLCSLAFSACANRPKQTENSQEATASPKASTTPQPTATPKATASPTPTVSPTPAAIFTNPLTGEKCSKDFSGQRPVAVIIEQNSGQFDIGNYTLIQPGGISKADIVYEMQVESITRNLAIFMDIAEAGDIYPIRSARSYFASAALAYDAIFAYCGYSAEGLEYAGAVIDPYYVDNDNLQISEGNVGWRQRAFPYITPHDMTANGADIAELIESQGARTTHRTDGYDYDLHFTENAVPSDGTVANHVHVVFPVNKTTDFTYDADKKGYTLHAFNSDMLDNVTGEKAVFQNILVLATYTAVHIDGKDHSAITTVNCNGTGWFINGGYAKQIRWSRGDYTDNFHYTNLDGTPLELGIGHTYIAFTSSLYCPDPTFS